MLDLNILQEIMLNYWSEKVKTKEILNFIISDVCEKHNTSIELYRDALQTD